MEDTAMVRPLFAHDIFSELDRLQREFQQALDPSPSIRGLGRSGFPALNVGSMPEAVEIFVFAPGLDPSAIDVNVDRGILTIAGERKASLPDADAKGSAVHVNERFAGSFRRVLSLPDDADPAGISATYRDGVLRLTVKRRESAQPRRISVQ
jgi:HSP20 family protein